MICEKKKRTVGLGLFCHLVFPLLVVGIMIPSSLTTSASCAEPKHHETECPSDISYVGAEPFEDLDLYASEETHSDYNGFGAQSVDYFEQPTFVSDYFANLTEHFPTNNSGNCGYTAAAMLLSYYDTYWNLNIIPDQFNDLTPSRVHRDDNHYSSPGVNDYYAPVWTEINPKMDPPKEGDRVSDYALKYYENEREAYSRYLDHMLAWTNDNIVSELYSIALSTSVNVYRFEIEPKPSLNAIGMKKVINSFLLKYGLADKMSLEYLHYNQIEHGSYPETKQREVLRKEAIERLKEGQPIVFIGKLSKYKYAKGVDGGGNQINDGYHAAIAYDYCDDGNIIGHMGWKGREEYSRMILDKEFETFDSFAYLEISPDLEFTPGNNRFYDHGLIAATDLYSHVHAGLANRAVIDYGDTSFHALQCVCGDVLYERHQSVVEQLDGRCHKVHCQKCGHDEFVEHTIIQIQGVGWYCPVCGAVFTYSNPPVISPWEQIYD